MYNRRPVFLWAPLAAGLICAGTNVYAVTEEEQQELNQLRFEIRQMRLINQSQVQQVEKLERRLRSLESQQLNETLKQKAQQPQAQQQPQQQAGAPVKREADRSNSVDDLMAQTHADFSRKWTLEVGLSYSHFDRKQLVLDGFLALDAIFLGDISVDNVESDIITLDLSSRFNINDRWQFATRIPFITRYNTYSESGVEVNVNEDFQIGDAELSSYYKLFSETPSRPDTVWSLRLKAPSGSHPYGVDDVTPTGLVDSNGDAVTITHPSELPTGSGLWALGTGLSFVKTTDPAILFASIEYTHQFARKFDDISSSPGEVVPGEVRLGDSIAFGLGMAFAVNDVMSISFSYSQTLQDEAETRGADGVWRDVVGSDANAATFNTGVTYSFGDGLSMATSLSIGLTPDSPDFSFGVRFPYSF